MSFSLGGKKVFGNVVFLSSSFKVCTKVLLGIKMAVTYVIMYFLSKVNGCELFILLQF